MFDLPLDLGEILEFVDWSSNSRFLILCQVTYDVRRSVYAFVLFLFDTEQSVVSEIVHSARPIKVKEISNAGEVSIV